MTYEINPLVVECFGGVTVQRAEVTSVYREQCANPEALLAVCPSSRHDPHVGEGA
jgi:hypothetical protein